MTPAEVSILNYARQHPYAVWVDEVTRSTALPRRVVRHRLETLTADGFLEAVPGRVIGYRWRRDAPAVEGLEPVVTECFNGHALGADNVVRLLGQHNDFYCDRCAREASPMLSHLAHTIEG